MGRKFDITAAFQAAVGEGVSKSDTREQIQYISLDKLDQDPGNFYSLDGLEELAANIQLCGLQQPLRVRPGENGRYIIVSGHRRRAALALLSEEEQKWTAVPCIVETDDASPELRELRLIMANSATRVLSAAEIARQAEEVEKLLYQLKEQGYEFPGRMRDQVAAACKVSAPKLARLKVIREHLIAQWQGPFQRSALPEQTAYALARMPEALQERLFRICGDKPLSGGAAERLLEAGNSGATWAPTFSCPDGSPCRRGDAFLRHDIEHPFELCLGEKCCLACSQAKASCYACDRMCSKARALRKESREDAARTEEERRAEQQRKYRADIQRSAARLLRAAEAAGLDDGAEIQPRSYYAAVSVADLRAYAAGEFGDKYFYHNDLAPEQLSHPEQIAQILGCSADYVLGLTEELHPGGAAPVWHFGEPETEGYYWCLTGPMSGGGRLLYWKGGRWCHEVTDLPLSVHVVCWFAGPPIPEGLTWERQDLEEGTDEDET